MNTRICLLALTAALAGGGCGGLLNPPKPKPIAYYALPGGGDDGASGAGFDIDGIANDSGAGPRMRYTSVSGEVIQDEYRRWADSPEQMVANILRSDFQGGAARLRASLFCWEIRPAEQKVRMGVEWNWRGRDARRAVYTADTADRTPEAFAAAFRQCVAQWENVLAAEAAAMEAHDEK